MEPEEARPFIHGSMFVNHLMYPDEPGKEVKYIDTVPIEGTLCHNIQVTMDTDYIVNYYIDIHSLLEFKVVNKDLKNGDVDEIYYSDYTCKDGIFIAKKIANYHNGEWESDLIIDSIQVNSGVIPFMFKMP